ncbi:pyoverdine biosynthesis protein [Pseudomonas sp. NPDC089530]|uniref:pyoverdine biosynthesis protein n=1 Tax=Pseudomonas sp. NPDC089530 TaxID=3390651 RepID=UPI003D047441
MSSLDSLSVAAIADTCRCAADAGSQALWLGGGKTLVSDCAPPPGGQVQALRGQAGQGDEWMAGWLSALVHSLGFDPGLDEPEAGDRRLDPQERCRHCQRPFDFSHKRAALLILAQGRGGERRQALGEVGCERACSR